jgi:TonB family protein
MVSAKRVENMEQKKTDRITARSASLVPYLKGVLEQIELHWNRTESEISPIVIFRIAPDGNVPGCRFSKATGKLKVDQPAIMAVKDSHFKPLPGDFSNGIDVQVEFSSDGPTLSCIN